MAKDSFYIATEDEIKEGKTTDVYFLRTKKVLQSESLNPEVYAEITTSSIKDSNWGVISGAEDVIDLLIGKSIDLYTLPEGTIFKARDINGIKIPVMVIIGKYLEFGEYETPLLGFLCSKSGITTKTARLRYLAEEKILLSFGARRAHPAITPIVSYCAYIGGCDGISCVLGAEKLNLSPMGTIPHSLIILFQDQVKAWKAYDKNISSNVPRIALVDTYYDEKIEAIMAVEAVSNLTGIRLDTPSSRKGNFKEIIQEVRWELDIRGYNSVKIFISGGLGENEISELKDVVDGFGVGTTISAAHPIDFAFDIVSLKDKSEKWIPVAKRGKFSGKKQVLRCENCLLMVIVPWNKEPIICPKCEKQMKNLLIKVLENGKRIRQKASSDSIRNTVLAQLQLVRKQQKEFFQEI